MQNVIYASSLLHILHIVPSAGQWNIQAPPPFTFFFPTSVALTPFLPLPIPVHLSPFHGTHHISWHMNNYSTLQQDHMLPMISVNDHPPHFQYWSIGNGMGVGPIQSPLIQPNLPHHLAQFSQHIILANSSLPQSEAPVDDYVQQTPAERYLQCHLYHMHWQDLPAPPPYNTNTEISLQSQNSLGTNGAFSQ